MDPTLQAILDAIADAKNQEAYKDNAQFDATMLPFFDLLQNELIRTALGSYDVTIDVEDATVVVSTLCKLAFDWEIPLGIAPQTLGEDYQNYIKTYFKPLSKKPILPWEDARFLWLTRVAVAVFFEGKKFFPWSILDLAMEDRAWLLGFTVSGWTWETCTNVRDKYCDPWSPELKTGKVAMFDPEMYAPNSVGPGWVSLSSKSCGDAVTLGWFKGASNPFGGLKPEMTVWPFVKEAEQTGKAGNGFVCAQGIYQWNPIGDSLNIVRMFYTIGQCDELFGCPPPVAGFKSGRPSQTIVVLQWFRRTFYRLPPEDQKKNCWETELMNLAPQEPFYVSALPRDFCETRVSLSRLLAGFQGDAENPVPGTKPKTCLDWGYYWPPGGAEYLATAIVYVLTALNIPASFHFWSLSPGQPDWSGGWGSGPIGLRFGTGWLGCMADVRQLFVAGMPPVSWFVLPGKVMELLREKYLKPDVPPYDPAQFQALLTNLAVLPWSVVGYSLDYNGQTEQMDEFLLERFKQAEHPLAWLKAFKKAAERMYRCRYYVDLVFGPWGEGFCRAALDSLPLQPGVEQPDQTLFAYYFHGLFEPQPGICADDSWQELQDFCAAQGTPPPAVAAKQDLTPCLAPGQPLPPCSAITKQGNGPLLKQILPSAQEAQCKRLLLLVQPLKTEDQFKISQVGDEPPPGFKDSFLGRVLLDIQQVATPAGSTLEFVAEPYVAVVFVAPSDLDGTDSMYADIAKSNGVVVHKYLGKEVGVGMDEGNILVGCVPAACIKHLPDELLALTPLGGIFPRPGPAAAQGPVCDWIAYDRGVKPCLTIASRKSLAEDFRLVGTFEDAGWGAVGRNLLALMYNGQGAPVWNIAKMFAEETAVPQPLPEPSAVAELADLSTLALKGVNYVNKSENAWVYQPELHPGGGKGSEEYVAVSQRESINLPLMKHSGVNTIAIGIVASTRALPDAQGVAPTEGDAIFFNNIGFPTDMAKPEDFPPKTPPEEYSYPEAKAATASDRQLVSTIRLAHLLGLKVMLKLYLLPLNVNEGQQAESAQAPSGLYQPKAGEDLTEQQKKDLWYPWWGTWFERYSDFIRHYARIAGEEKVEFLCLGEELWSSVGRSYIPNYEDAAAPQIEVNGWKDLLVPAAAKYKELFPEGTTLYGASQGPLSLGVLANAPPIQDKHLLPCLPDAEKTPNKDVLLEGYAGVDFWDGLDAVGITLFPESQPALPFTFEGLYGQFKSKLTEVGAFVQAQYGNDKKVIITRSGACSLPSNQVLTPGAACCGPGGSQPEADYEAQTLYFRALAAAIHDVNAAAATPFILGLVLDEWGNSTCRTVFPRLLLPLDRNAFFENFAVNPENHYYRPLALPSSAASTLEPLGPPPCPDCPPEGYAVALFNTYKQTYLLPYSMYAGDYAVVGKPAHALLYLAYWGIVDLITN